MGLEAITNLLNKGPKNLKQASINISASGDTTIVTQVTGKRIKVYAIVLVCQAAVTVILNDGTAAQTQAALTGGMSFAANGGYAQAVTPPNWIFATSAGKALVINLGSGVQVSGYVAYWSDDSV